MHQIGNCNNLLGLGSATPQVIKGALDNIDHFPFDSNSFIMWKVIANKQIQKEKFKNSFRKWKKSLTFVKHEQTGDEAN